MTLVNRMKSNTMLQKPCVYHFLFSRLPDYRTNEDVTNIAQELSSPTILKYELEGKKEFLSPHPEVIPLLYRSNDESQTYLLQFWFNDILTTILTFNRVDPNQSVPHYFQMVKASNFPNLENHMKFGDASVLFAQGQDEIANALRMAAVYSTSTIESEIQKCQFDWGSLYFFPNICLYVLLIPEEENLTIGDTLLAFDFPMLEAIRQKLLYEESESKTLKARNTKIELDLRKQLDSFNNNLDQSEKNFTFLEKLLDRMDDTQAELYDNISKTECLLHTLTINIRNFETYLQSMPTKSDTLFRPMIRKFHFIHENIEAGLKYTKMLLPGIEKRKETIPLKIDLLRQKAQEQSNRIEKRQNMLIAVLGVMIGTGEVLGNIASIDWQQRLALMAVSGALAFLLVNLLNLKIFDRPK